MAVARTLSLLWFAAGALAAGCAAPEGDGAQTSAVSAFTVSHGDRFIVSATPERIVLSKEVDGVPFPFDEASLLGKALLIHPVDRRAATGVYARALSVESEGNRLVVTSEPLTLAEMESIAEDDIVRIYVDASRLDGSGLRPQVAGNFGALGFNGLNFSAFEGLSAPSFLGAGITLSHEVQKVSVSPDVLIDWSHENGLELGMRSTFAWHSKLTVGGQVGGEFYHSTTISTPSVVVTVPIGPVPVPITLSASAFVACAAVLSGPISVEVAIDADANVGGSFYVHPTSDTAPTDWVHQGTWTPEATGTASVTPTFEGKLDGTISCAIPRIDLKALVAGVAGPYLAITPSIAISDNSSFSIAIAAGVQGKLLGEAAAAEVTLLSWTP
jgi:hypothetical protein